MEEGEPYTLLAPNDAAFAKLPGGVLEALLQPENRSALNLILEHHVLPDGVAGSSQLTDGQSIRPAFGSSYTVGKRGGAVTIGDARVVRADIRTENGVVHAIDTVLVPQIVTDALRQRGVLPER